MKLHETQGFFYKIDRIHYSMFNVGRSMFDVKSYIIIHCQSFTLSIKLAAYQASGSTEHSYENSILKFLYIDQTGRSAASGWADT
jgi:hypothetical protein